MFPPPRAHNVPVIYSNDAHLPVDEEVVERWGKHAIKGTKGAEVIPELKPVAKDYVLRSGRTAVSTKRG
jgi:nicotinamidase-related amidase